MISEVGSQKPPQRYLIERANGEYSIGVKSDQFPNGNREEYPLFELEDGSLYGCHVSRVTEIKEGE